MNELGGVVFDTGEELRFVPSSIAVAVAHATRVVPVPGLAHPACGVTLADDHVVTVLQAGSAKTNDLLLCDIDGVIVAISGLRVMATGSFRASSSCDGCVEWGGRIARPFDARALYFEAEQAVWSARGLRQDTRQA